MHYEIFTVSPRRHALPLLVFIGAVVVLGGTSSLCPGEGSGCWLPFVSSPDEVNYPHVFVLGPQHHPRKKELGYRSVSLPSTP